MPLEFSRFSFSLHQAEHDWEVLAFEGSEAISQPFSYRIEVISRNGRLRDLTPANKGAALALDDLLLREAYLGFDGQGHGVHGLIHSVSEGEAVNGVFHYRVVLKPGLAVLEHGRRRRIFERKNVREILAEVLRTYAIAGDESLKFELTRSYPVRDYCVQFDESDLAFVQRLCAEAGLHYHFTHSPTAHVLVIADDRQSFPSLEAAQRYGHAAGMAADCPTVDRFTVRSQLRPGVSLTAHYDYRESPGTLGAEDSASGPAVRSGVYHYAPSFLDDVNSHQRHRRLQTVATQELEAQRCEARLAEGASNQRQLSCALGFDLEAHPQASCNGAWRIIRISHQGRMPQELQEHSGGAAAHYSNQFSAIPAETPFRSELADKPRLHSQQLAIVVGGDRGAPVTDGSGRVKVRFCWDQSDRDTGWIRVASGWAGQDYGALLTPRVGMEVLVGFIDGDIDQPIVMGCTRNARTPAPAALPRESNLSVLRSRSVPDNGGFSELRVDDTQGRERIDLRAERDLHSLVGHDAHLEVGNARKVRVGGPSTHELLGDAHSSVQGNASFEYRRDAYHQVEGTQHVRTANHLLEAREEIHLKAGQQLVLDGGMALTIKAGGHWLTLSHAGIFSSVPIKQGGAPLGGRVAGSLNAEPIEPTPQLQLPALIGNFARRAPVCEICTQRPSDV